MDCSRLEQVQGGGGSWYPPSIGAETAAELEGGRDELADDEEGSPKSKGGGKTVWDWLGDPGRE